MVGTLLLGGKTRAELSAASVTDRTAAAVRLRGRVVRWPEPEGAPVEEAAELAPVAS